MKRHEAISLGVFIRKIVIDYLRYGYFRYVVREIPEGCDLDDIDEKILKEYDVTFNRVLRKSRRDAGNAVVLYIRYKRLFILLATDGRHEAFDQLAWKDIREFPLQVCGLSIGDKGGTPWVSIGGRRLKGVARFAKKISLYPEPRVRSFLKTVFCLRFPGVVLQEKKLLFRINQRRKKAGLSQIRVEKGYKIPKKAA